MQGPGPRGHETWLYAAQEGIMTPKHGPRDQTDSCTTDMGLAIGSVGARGQQHMHRCSLQRPRVLAQGCRLREQYTSALNTLHRGALSTHILILGHMEGREHKDSGLHPYTNGLGINTHAPTDAGTQSPMHSFLQYTGQGLGSWGGRSLGPCYAGDTERDSGRERASLS